jgi:lysophospholipase L1-like esterase
VKTGAAEHAAEDGPKQPQFSRLRSAVYGGVVTLAFFGVLELAVRLWGVAPMLRPALLLHSIDEVSEFPYMQADRNLFWAPRPGYTGKFHGRQITINSLGCRGPEPGPRRPGRRRLVCFGDSITFGYDVGDRETYASFLGRELPGVDVLNAGVNGYSSHQVLARLRLLEPRVNPDVATFLVGWNDRVERPVDDRTYAGRIRTVMAVEGPLDHLRLFAALKRLYLGLFRHEDASPVRVPRVSVAQYRENLLAMVEVCRARGITPVFIELPRRHPATVRDAASLYPAALRATVRGAGVRLVEAGPLSLAARVNNESYFVDSLHLSPKGHALLTRQILAALREMGVGAG